MFLSSFVSCVFSTFFDIYLSKSHELEDFLTRCTSYFDIVHVSLDIILNVIILCSNSRLLFVVRKRPLKCIYKYPRVIKHKPTQDKKVNKIAWSQHQKCWVKSLLFLTLTSYVLMWRSNIKRIGKISLVHRLCVLTARICNFICIRLDLCILCIK